MASKYGASVAEGRPDLVKQWHPRNELSPDQVKPGSTKRVWWVCDKGHEWEAPVDNRVYNNTGCPFCTTRGGKRLRPGTNDLATVNPALAAEWHPTKNEGVSPTDTLPSVKVRYWWLCSTCGREWRALLNMRHSQGTGCPSCRGRKRGLKSSGSDHLPHLYEEWSPRNDLPLSEFSVYSRNRALWKCRNGHEWVAAIGDRNLKATGCKQCGSGGTSTPESDLREFVESLGVEVRAHHRQIDPLYEYDITVPSQKIAIEFNGLYWHSERFKGQKYHLNKTLAAENAGWSLIHVWEDDWRDRRSVVEQMLAHKLGVSRLPKYNARSLEIREVPAPDAKKFLEDNHIQGPTPGSVRAGLYSGEDLVALAVFRSRGSGTWELSRYATSGNVRGGFSKLLKAGVSATDAKRIVTFSDNTVSSGCLYEATGFHRDRELPPDYSYRVGPNRVHKFNYRKARFERDPGLKFEAGLTERELAELNGLDRIYDAGKVRWVLIV